MRIFITLFCFTLILSFGLIQAQVPDYVPKDGLIGWWPFNGNANDESENGNHGQIFGSTLTTDRNGVNNSAYSFNGIDNSIFLGNWFDYLEFSVSIWIKPSPQSGYVTVLDNNHTHMTNWVFHSLTDNQYYSWSDNPILLEPDKWHHIVFSYKDSTGQLYHNGKLAGELTTYKINYTRTPALTLGASVEYGRFWKGDMDEIGIWNRALNDNDVKRLFQAGVVTSNVPKFVPKDDLIGWWPFNGNANDESGNNQHLLPYQVSYINDFERDTVAEFKGQSWMQRDSLDDGVKRAYTFSFWGKSKNKSCADIIGIACSTDCWADLRIQFNGSQCGKEGLSFKSPSHFATVKSDINDDEWHHYAVVLGSDSNYSFSNFKFYIDGVLNTLDSNDCGHNWGGWKYIPDTTFPLSIGKGLPLGGSYIGLLDDVGIWNRALNDQEIKILFDSLDKKYNVPDYVSKNGLLGWWPFNGNANDESGNGNHGTANGPFLSKDRFDKDSSCYKFNGNTDLISTTYSQVLGNAVTVSYWTQLDSLTPAWLIVQGGTQSGDISYDFDLGTRLGGNGILSQYVFDGKENWLGNDTLLQGKNTWYHIVYGMSSNGMKLYINSKLVATNSNVTSNQGLNGFWRFGGCTHPGQTSLYGKLDDIGIWNRELDSNEVQKLYNQQLSNCYYTIKESDTSICPGNSVELNAVQTSSIKSEIPKNGLIGYWPFNGNANDESGNGNNGTVNGAILTTDRCDSQNQAFSFKGKSWIEVPNANYIDSNNIGSISFWVKSNSLDQLAGVCKSTSSDSIDFRIFGDANDISFIVNGKDFHFLNSSGSLDKSKWNNLIVTFNDNDISLYINGKLQAKPTLKTTWPITKSTTMKFGFDNHGMPEYLDGSLDEIAIWKRVLTNEEVQQVYYSSPCGCTDTLSNDKFVWSDGQKGRKITVKPDTTTTYVLSVADGATLHRDSIKVTVGGDSCITCIYGIKQNDTTICQGTVLELNAEIDTVSVSIPKDGLLGWWPFNGNANDESGNGNHGIVDRATLTSDKNNAPNSAYRFYKSGSKVTIPDATMLNNPSLSLSFWVKTSDSTQHSYIYKSQEDTAYNEEYGIVSNFTRSNSLEFSVKNASNCIPAKGWERNIKDTVIFDGKWHHISATYDGIYSRIYVDADLISEIQKPFFPIDSCPGGNILFGKGWNNDANLDGILDDIAIWNRTITQEEVKKMYELNRPKPAPSIPTDGLVGYWPFDGNAKDQTSFENHGTVKGATLTTDRCQKRNSAYEFNGLDNVIEVANSESLSNVESITMSAWILLDSMRSREQGILTKWFQLQDCNKNTDAYELIVSKSNSTGNIPKLVGATSRYFYYQNQSVDTIVNSIWQHVVFVHDKNSGGKLYLDGNVINIYNQSGSICSSKNPLLIGADNNRGTYWRFFDGRIDDIAIWNRPLSDSEVAQVYNAGSCNCTDTLPEDKFTWSTGEKGRKISVSPNSSTMYTLEVDRGKKIDRDTIHVTVLESPTPDIFGHVKVYERQINYSYYTPFNDSSTYEWSITGNGKLSSTNGGSSILVDFKEPGYAYLTVTETNKYGCKKDTTITIRIYRMTDIADSEIDSEELNIYPNPMNEFGSVMVKAFIPPSTHASVSIVDMLGKNLVTSELDGQNAYREIHVPISTESLVNGIYMIQLRMDGTVISKKLIINR